MFLRQFILNTTNKNYNSTSILNQLVLQQNIKLNRKQQYKICQIRQQKNYNNNQIWTEKNKIEYEQNGCTIVDNIVSENKLDELINQMSLLIKQNINNLLKDRVCFSKGEMEISKQFIDSGDKIGFFFEPNVIDQNNQLLVPQDQLFNKVGHALHDIDKVFEKFSYNPVISNILNEIGYKKPTCIQSMYIFKNAKVGTPVSPHTDNTYLVTQPQSSAVGFWFALHDATVENGCMWGIPGSHKYPATHHMYRNDEGDKLSYYGTPKQYDVNEAVPYEVKRGQVFIFHGDFVHLSKHNNSTIPRHAYALHFIDSHKSKWHEKNWLQRSQQVPFRDYNTVINQLYS